MDHMPGTAAACPQWRRAFLGADSCRSVLVTLEHGRTWSGRHGGAPMRQPLPGRAPGLSEHALRRLRHELSLLDAQRDQLRGNGAGGYGASDSGDRAEALRRADDVSRLEARIAAINRLLSAGRQVPAPRSATDSGAESEAALDEGSTVTLRFGDGGEETFYASSVLDIPPTGLRAEILGLGSPLARALAGRDVGDKIAWATPTGTHHADVVGFEPAVTQAVPVEHRA